MLATIRTRFLPTAVVAAALSLAARDPEARLDHGARTDRLGSPHGLPDGRTLTVWFWNGAEGCFGGVG